MNITPYGKPLSENDIEKFEKSLNIKLPEDYKAFMLKNNGGKPEVEIGYYVFDFTDISRNQENSTALREFYSIVYEKPDNYYIDIIDTYENYIEEEQLPKNILPIGDDPLGNEIGICVSGENYGKIYFCDHESYDENDFMIMSPVADSFSEFLNSWYIKIYD
jgi:cell wall assembly regulator SMI1